MKYFAFAFLLISACIMFQSCTEVNAEAEPKDKLTSPSNVDHNAIEGVWLTLASSWNENTKEFADNTTYKIYTKNHFANIFFKEGKFMGSGGGKYTVEGDHFTEHLDYFSFDETAIGESYKFRFEIYGDSLLRQSGTLTTEKYPEYNIEQFYIRKDGPTTSSKPHDLVGVWNLESATWGEDKRSQADIVERYGRITKIITPGYFHVAYYDKDKKTFGGAVFGKVKMDEKQLTEVVKTFYWDNSAAGNTYTFDWTVEGKKFHQVGKINSDEYKDYLIDEWYSRVE